MNIKKDIKFIYCSFAPVGLEDYVEYIKNHFADFIYFKWRFHFIDSKRLSSSVQIFNECILIKEKRLFPLPKVNNRFIYFLTLPIIYLVYLFQAIRNLIGVKTKDKIVIFMGINYFCTLCGIILKYLRVIDFVIYRVMDFFPMPKKGAYRIFNGIFYILDRISLRFSDARWFTTIGHIEGREEYGYFDRRKTSFEIIPLGIRQGCISSSDKIKEFSIVYCGNINRYHMLDMLFNSVRKLKNKYPAIRLNIIGSGRDEIYFKELVRKMGLDGNIYFYGFVKDDRIIAENSIGVALYSDEEDFMKYTEPAKVKAYLGYGVPVIVSKVTRIAEEIAKNRVGFSIRNSEEELEDVLESFFDNRQMQDEYRRNIVEYVKRFDINKLLDKMFTNTFDCLGVRNG